jgi:AcrR family transcriptional regulator
MARPKSDGKRKAILDAAKHIFAERGISNSPTSAISKAAGVAEGSLFIYFHSKDELMNELYRELRSEFDREFEEFPYKADAKTRVRFAWDRFINLAMEEPIRLTVLRQLRSSGRLFKDAETPGIAILEMLHTVKEAVQGGSFQNAPAEFLILLLRAHAEATVEYILAHPEQEAVSREVGFGLVWNGLAGQ